MWAPENLSSDPRTVVGMAEETIIVLRESAAAPAPGRADSVESLERHLEAALAARPAVLVLDVAAVERPSSTTIAMLLWARRRCAAQGAQIVLRHANQRWRTLLSRTGLREVVPLETVRATSGRRRLVPTPSAS